MSTTEEFLKGLDGDEKKVDNSMFNDTVPAKAVETEDEVVAESVKNRRHKRLEAQLRAEQESNIALAERIKVLSEVEKFSKENSSVDPDIAKLFDASESGKENALRLSAKFQEFEQRAEERAIARLREEQRSAQQEQKNLESFIDNQFEALEDEYNVDLTSDAPAARKARREFGELLEKVSPKDESGEIKEYADFFSTFELYKSQKSETPSRNKEIASRSMQRSGVVDSVKQNDENHLAYLRSIGVRV